MRNVSGLVAGFGLILFTIFIFWAMNIMGCAATTPCRQCQENAAYIAALRDTLDKEEKAFELYRSFTASKIEVLEEKLRNSEAGQE